jgi:hypothetical protein
VCFTYQSVRTPRLLLLVVGWRRRRAALPGRVRRRRRVLFVATLHGAGIHRALLARLESGIGVFLALGGALTRLAHAELLDRLPVLLEQADDARRAAVGRLDAPDLVHHERVLFITT